MDSVRGLNKQQNYVERFYLVRSKILQHWYQNSNNTKNLIDRV